MLGTTACRSALQGKSGLDGFSERDSAVIHQCAIPQFLSVKAPTRRKVPDDYINECRNDVDRKMMEYLKLLIHGETEIIYENGIPKHLYLY